MTTQNDASRDLRRAEMRALMALVDPDLTRAGNGLSEAITAEDSVHDRPTRDAALDVLRAISQATDSLNTAQQKLALTLSDRGEQTTRIAEAAGVNRATVNRWKRDRT